MSATYTQTDNYHLNLYGNNDPADLRDGYNGSMRTIDTTLETHLFINQYAPEEEKNNTYGRVRFRNSIFQVTKGVITVK